MLKVITIVGARPQFIKAAVVSRAFNARSQEFVEKIIHTGQHYDENMSDIFFDELKIPRPAYNLGVGGGSHGKNTGRMLEAIEEVLLVEKPDVVLVYGDTDSTLAGALAAAKLHIPVAHVEAGLRSFNKRMPEEINRVLTDNISDFLFAPTTTSVDNLKNEGISGSNVFNVGDVMYDAALFYESFSRKPESLNAINEFYLTTIHRAENTDDPSRLKEIISALKELAKNCDVVLPLHPRTRNVLDKEGINLSGLIVINPVGYLEMVWLLKNCKMVITDSGGLQKEAYFFNKQAVVLRLETEWVELLENGWNVLGGYKKETILTAVEKLYNREPLFSDHLYGTGKTGEEIVEKLFQLI
jgi:UDP-GlcNAc3NAcA epimerase